MFFSERAPSIFRAVLQVPSRAPSDGQQFGEPPSSSDSRRSGRQLVKIHTNICRFGLMLVECSPSLVECWEGCASAGRGGPKLVELGPDLGSRRSSSTSVAQLLAKLNQAWLRVWPDLAQIRPSSRTCGRNQAEFDRNRAGMPKVAPCQHVFRLRPELAELGPNLDQAGPNWD